MDGPSDLVSQILSARLANYELAESMGKSWCHRASILSKGTAAHTAEGIEAFGPRNESQALECTGGHYGRADASLSLLGTCCPGHSITQMGPGIIKSKGAAVNPNVVTHSSAMLNKPADDNDKSWMATARLTLIKIWCQALAMHAPSDFRLQVWSLCTQSPKLLCSHVLTHSAKSLPRTWICVCAVGLPYKERQ